MQSQTKKLACGHDVPREFDPEQVEVIGRVIDLVKLDPISYEAEITELYSGMELYYYYEEKTFQYISDGTPPKAQFKNLCESCLIESLKKEDPHYGDGVYFTQHSCLFDQNTHSEVVQSHGIPYRPHRATYTCMDESVFRKIYKTGGVIRSSKHRIEDINNTKMVSIEEGVVFPLCLGW
ncbi:hypothetical protein [Bacillus sp. FJAT-52991]|uniref:Uncharacterized protein n=1 Tax=Bacillus kandeliae TaxID=3129297 RepID=A0ABZ2NBD7_9BACI